MLLGIFGGLFLTSHCVLLWYWEPF